MAKCKSCGIDVTTGTEYCKNCESKRKADESYLDSLLSSVMSADIPRNEVQKQKKPVPNKEKETENRNSESFMESNADNGNNRSFVQETAPGAEPAGSQYSIHDELDDSFFDELFQKDLDEFELDDEDQLDETDNIFPDFPARTVKASNAERFEPLVKLAAEDEIIPEEDIFSEEQFEDGQDLQDHISLSESKDVDTMEGDFPEMLDDILSEYPEEQEINNTTVDPDEINDMLGELFEQAEVSKEEEEIPDFGNLEINETSAPSFDDIQNESMGSGQVQEFPKEDTKSEDQELFDSLNEDDDIMAFWNSINADEPEENLMEEEVKPSAVSRSVDSNYGARDDASAFDDSDLRDLIPDINEVQNSKKAKKKKKKGLLQRLFGNIKQERSDEEIEKLKAEALAKFDEDEIAASNKKEADKQAKIEAKKKKEEDAKKSQEDKAASSEKKKEQKLVKLEKKKELKDKREQARRELLDEIENEDGKINKFGASFIFVLFAVILVVVVAGTNIYTYRVAIASADTNFNLDRYDEAYNDVYGLDIQDEDIALYEKIITVMYVNKQLNSYQVFHAKGNEAEALNSLLKGLMRYNKYIFYGTQLGIEDDLNGVRSEIVYALNETYGLSEDDANVLISSDSQAVYSARVYEVIDNLPAN